MIVYLTWGMFESVCTCFMFRHGLICVLNSRINIVIGPNISRLTYDFPTHLLSRTSHEMRRNTTRSSTTRDYKISRRYKLRVAAWNGVGLGNFSNTTAGWTETGVKGNITVLAHNNASMTSPGVHKDQPFQLRVVLTGENNKTTVGKTNITVTTTATAGGCAFAHSRNGQYNSSIILGFGDGKMVATNAWIKCDEVVNATGGPKVIAVETYRHSANDFEPFMSQGFIVYDEPTEPRHVIARDGGPSTVALTWSEPATDNSNPITHYLVRARGEAGYGWDSETPNRTYLYTNLQEYTQYNFTIFAVNEAGRGAGSLVVPFKSGVTGQIDVQMVDGRMLYSDPGFEVASHR